MQYRPRRHSKGRWHLASRWSCPQHQWRLVTLTRLWGGGGVLEDRSGYDCGGGCMKPRLCGGQQPVEGGGGHVEGPPAVGDPSHNIIGDWLF
jgi:hypothetical protein